jgi:hypothetical protein
LLDISGGTVKGSKIEWPVGNLAGGASGEIKFKVKVGLVISRGRINNKQLYPVLRSWIIQPMMNRYTG